jgi:tetratricopeptide (TPR) repeat protein
MKKRILILGILGFGFLNVIGQEIHSPAEIFKIMEKSSVTYELNALEKEILPKDRTDNLNYNHYYRVNNEGQISTLKYEIDSNVQIYLTKAEEYFHAKKFSLAREMYLDAFREDSTFFMVMTYIGQTYGIEGDFDKAIEWYKKTIDLNYIDYMAHWFLADAYKSKGELDKAVDEITIARILNRNNPRIEKSLKSIYELKKLKTPVWTFNPQMEIDSIGVNKVRILFDSDWLGYAMVKALWKYEPGYKKSMGVSEGSFSIIEEKESFVSLMTSFDKKKLKKHPEFKALKLALDKDMIDEFIFYEIVLPEYPFVAYQLPIEFIDGIKNYVIEIRGKQK